MKIAINILKVLEIIITAIWGILLGIFVPILLKGGDIAPQVISESPVLTVWIVSSSVYLVGTLILMLKYYKVATGFHLAGLGSSIYIYSAFENLRQGIEAENPAILYMPLIFLAIITIVITLLANYGKINEMLNKDKEKEYEAAPSLLGGEYKAKSGKKEK